MIRWNVYSKGKRIDGVFYQENCNADYIKETLINEDGFPKDIIIKRVRGAHPKN